VRGVVVTGGNGPDAGTLRAWTESAERVIAADSGLELALSAGVEPDLVVGDMDSLADRGLLARFSGDRVRPFPAEKDDTDTEIALDMLFCEGCDEVVLAGGGGGRLDHLIGILALFDRERHPAVWLTALDEVVAIDSVLERSGMSGRRVSFFPVGTEVCRMSSDGLKWPLDGLEWHHGDVGISNVVTGDPFRVEMHSGRLIMVRALEHSR
jgi:thiamine pyrophosphokinase